MDPFTELEHGRWQGAAGPYHDGFGTLTSQTIAPLLDAVGARPGMRLLDVATGPGYVAAAAGRLGARATGVDFSSEMVAQARRLHPAVEFREGDAQALPFEAEGFDAVVCAYGLLHFAEPERALAEARRVLRRGGRIAFCVWAPPERARAFGIVLDIIKEHGDPAVSLPPAPPFFRFADPDECVRALRAAGFAQPRVTEVPQTWRLDSAHALFQTMLHGTARTGALLRLQTAERLARIRAAVDAAARGHSRDGGVEFTMPAVVSSAVAA